MVRFADLNIIWQLNVVAENVSVQDLLDLKAKLCHHFGRYLCKVLLDLLHVVSPTRKSIDEYIVLY